MRRTCADPRQVPTRGPQPVLQLPVAVGPCAEDLHRVRNNPVVVFGEVPLHDLNSASMLLATEQVCWPQCAARLVPLGQLCPRGPVIYRRGARVVAAHTDPAGRYGAAVNSEEIAAGLAPTPGYRYAERSGSQLFVAGQVPLDSTGSLVGADSPADQTVQCLANLRVLLEVHGFATSDVKHLRVYVVGPHQHLLDAWAAVVEWFGGETPPATLLGVQLLGYTGQLVEIDASIHR